jgi:cyclic pyranopterin phosphate synthase
VKVPKKTRRATSTAGSVIKVTAGDLAGGLTHFDPAGNAHMVAVTAKAESERLAVASGAVLMAAATATAVRAGKIGKGDVLGVARIAGIAAAKRAAEWIPLCHPVRLTAVSVEFVVEPTRVLITATATAFDRTGVEMEALAAVSAAGLCIYDMCKAIDRGMVLSEVRLERKQGGRSGTWVRSPG